MFLQTAVLLRDQDAMHDLCCGVWHIHEACIVYMLAWMMTHIHTPVPSCGIVITIK